MAVKAAAKASSLDTGRAVSGFYFHRFLCRIFSRQDSPFVLKGGQSMLARTADARATRDIDLLSEKAGYRRSARRTQASCSHRPRGLRNLRICRIQADQGRRRLPSRT
ncbi:nucleotidyl transferase AbiEii/AbiGii toxin family protein [Gordonibacter pamelaeae]|nr:nucleotidyl transferase AbiEii/AbiGii toxin family protein [Gordonibacter pamelaeae]MCQ4848475.1 nucleotidyl transferase AbiEii/AbiGii toxin family protein [Gordonibacter pamelaeae]